MALPLDTRVSLRDAQVSLRPPRPIDPERRLEELARAGAPLRRATAALAGRLVARRAWERLGYARLGDYARERLGLSARWLQELARVDRALAERPALEVALVSGRLPWSKVRLLARCAEPGDEAGWIELAERTSVRALERRCRSVARGARAAEELAADEEGADTSPVETLRLRAPVALAFAWRQTIRAAEQVAGEKLGAAGTLEFVTAEALAAGLAGPGGDTANAGELASSATPEAGAVHGEGEGAADFSEPVPDPSEAMGHEVEPAAQASGESEPSRPNAPTPMAVGTDGAVRGSASTGLPRFLEPLVAGLEAADAFELDARLRRAVRLAQKLDAEIAPLLRQVTSSEFEWRERYRTLAAYARERLGMSPRKARALLRLERLGDLCPALRAAYRDGALSWLQAQALAPLLVSEGEGRVGEGEGDWREAWVAFAGRVTLRRLDELVGEALALREVDPLAESRPWEDPERLAAGLEVGLGARFAAEREAEPEARPDAEPAARWDAEPEAGSDDERQMCARPMLADAATNPLGDVHIRVTAPRETVRLFRALLCRVRLAVERRSGKLPGEAEGFAVLLAHALESWGIDDRRLRRQLGRRLPVFERDGWRCTVPGCTSRRNLQAHHIVFRSVGGDDSEANQTTLCAFHHQRGVHGGTLRITGRAPAELCFELGTRAGRPPLARYRSGDRLVGFAAGRAVLSGASPRPEATSSAMASA